MRVFNVLRFFIIFDVREKFYREEVGLFWVCFRVGGFSFFRVIDLF